MLKGRKKVLQKEREISIIQKEKTSQNISGDDNDKEIPVPIPNTEVKLISAKNT